MKKFRSPKAVKTLSVNNKIYISKDIRNKIGINKGSKIELLVNEEDNQILIQPVKEGNN